MNKMAHIKAIALVAVFICIASPIKGAAAGITDTLPAFTDFVSSVTNGQANLIRGVYVPGVLAFPVLQQPANDGSAVIAEPGVVTQFGAAAVNQVIGLLAHNNLAGATFSNLKLGQEIRIIYGDGHVEYYAVSLISSFQAEQPENPYSTFLDQKSNLHYSAQDIFNMFYTGSPHLIFQTCIARDGVPSWGRLFITAVPTTVLSNTPSRNPELISIQPQTYVYSLQTYMAGFFH